MGWIIPLLNFLGSLFKYFADRRLIEVGKQEERANVDKAEAEAQAKVDKVIVDVDAMSDADVTSRLQKWRRKD